MPTETFQFYTYVNIGTGQTTSVSYRAPYTASDVSDGSNNGITAIGDNVFLDTIDFLLMDGPFRLLGTTTNGIILQNGANQFLLSNAEYVINQPLIGLNTTDPYNYCFLSGTLIATPSGEVPVEHLKIGDLVTTADGRAVPVKWLGEQRLRNSMFTPARMAPVCIAKGALGEGLPHGDLYVSADHGLMIDGLVINAGALVNGSTIRFVPMAEMEAYFTYYHVETEAHDVILANGTAAETFIDYAGRQVFDNYAEYEALYEAERIIPEMERPRISSARQVPPQIKARLAAGVDWEVALADPEMSVTLQRGAA